MRREIPMFLSFTLAMVAIVTTWINFGEYDVRALIDEYFLVFNAFIILLGVINLTRIHATNVRRRRTYWSASLWLLICMYAYILLGIYETNQGINFRFIWTQWATPTSSTLFSMLTFYIASAAYRAFRVRSREATLLLVVGVIVMLGRAPIGASIWSGIPVLQSWIMDIPNVAARRGLMLGAGLGTYAALIRVLLGLERGHLGGAGQ